MISRTSRAAIGALAMIATGLTAAPALAQDNSAEARLRKLESEMRAVQRQVFPGGDGRFFEPQIASGTQPRTTPTTPSTTAVTDILARLDALEAQIATLTAQTEQNSNAIVQLTTRLGALEVTTTAASTPAPTPAPVPGTASTGNLQAMGAAPATRPAAQPAAPAAAAATGPTAQRLAAVQAIAKPQTSDAADDEYSYGFRLWEAGFYPEAQQQLTMFVEKYPRHSRATFGRNLLGRAYLDDGKPREAASWFLRNYQADKSGARAADSLLYLAEAMIASNDTNRACIALAEFSETYPAIATGRLSSQYQASRRKVTCN
mgnify:CR=1 FL=1